MARSKTPAPRPKYMKRQTEIHPPNARTVLVDGKVKTTWEPAKVGPTTIFESDDDDEFKPAPRAMTPQIKREPSINPSRAKERGRSRRRHPRIKRESTFSTPRGYSSPKMPSFPAGGDQPGKPQMATGPHGWLQKGKKMNPSRNSLSSSDSDGAGFEQNSASSSSDSDSGDHDTSSSSDSESDAYTPSTCLSPISSTSPRTLRQDTQAPAIKAGLAPAARESTVAEQESRSKCKPLDFYINVPTRPAQCQASNDKPSRPSPQTSLQEAASPQANRRARSRSRHSSHVSPKVLGFLPINRGPLPEHAPTEPQAMRIAKPLPETSTNLNSEQRHNHVEKPIMRSSLTAHELPPAGVRPLGSTRRDLGAQRPISVGGQAARNGLTSLPPRPQPRRRPCLPSQAQAWARARTLGQSNSAAGSSSGSRHEQIRGTSPGPQHSHHPYQALPEPSSQVENFETQNVNPCGGQPSSSLGEEVNLRQDNTLASPNQKSNNGKGRRRGKSKQRRGPARPGRTMQTVEQPGMDVSLSPVTPAVHDAHPRPYRPATPGPSCLRKETPVHPQSSPGLFVTPNTPFCIRPFASSPTQTAKSRGKRPRDDTEGLDPATRKSEWTRILERIRSHEMEMQKTRDMLAEQQRRIDELEQQRRIDELLQELERQEPVEKHRQADRGAGSRQNEHRVQHEHRQVRRQPTSRQQKQDEPRAEQQSETRQRESSRRQHSEHQHVSGQGHRGLGLRGLGDPVELDFDRVHQSRPSPKEAQQSSQRRLKREVLEYPLSGHNPRLNFDDDDKPNVSEATAFLLRVSQEKILERVRQYIKNKDFFDVGHPGFKSMGCWVISGDTSHDIRMKLSDQGEEHKFPFRRLAIRLWHDEDSMYSLLQGKTQQKARHVCHNSQCMYPRHIQVESSKEYGERQRCRKIGWCTGHVTNHKDGTMQRRKWCIFPSGLAR